MQWLWIFSPYLILSALIGLGCGNIYVFYGDRNVDEFPDAELPFSRPISKLGIEGVILKADPPDACSDISGPPVANNSFNWFVLISGNLCDYGTKIFYSERAGFSAVIIYSLKGSEESLYAYDHRHARPNISAVVIRTSSGLMIKEKYLYTVNQKYRISIFQNNTVSVMTFLMLFAIVIGVFVAIMVIFMIIKYVKQAHTRRNDRLSSRHLNQLQISRYERGCPYETCAICLEDYKERDKLRILPCLHGYHVKCIDPWLTNNRRICPVCKQKIAFDGESTDNDLDFDSEIRSERTPLLRSSNERHHGTFLVDSSLFEPVHDLTQGAAAEAETQRVPQSFAEIPEVNLSRLEAVESFSESESNGRQDRTFLGDSTLFQPVHNDMPEGAAFETETQMVPQSFAEIPEIDLSRLAATGSRVGRDQPSSQAQENP